MKTQGGVDTYAIVCMCAVVVLLAAYFIIHNARKKKRIANRCKQWKESKKPTPYGVGFLVLHLIETTLVAVVDDKLLALRASVCFYGIFVKPAFV